MSEPNNRLLCVYSVFKVLTIINCRQCTNLALPGVLFCSDDFYIVCFYFVETGFSYSLQAKMLVLLHRHTLIVIFHCSDMFLLLNFSHHGSD